MPLERVRGALERCGVRDGGLLVAVSAGLDSTALLAALHELSQEWGLKLSIGHVNHGLRGAASEADQAAVQALGERLGVRVLATRVDPGSLREGRSSRERPTRQEAARSLRYAALRAQAREAGARWIATAHHADDQAETVLLRLLRGTGPDGLAGIPESSPDGRIVRPLLRVSRPEIESFARSRCLTWRHDASNDCREYARNRLRHEWIPGLRRDFNPRLLRAIGDLAEAAQRDSEWIESLVEREAASRMAAEDGWLRIDAKDWSGLPAALARRLARRALRESGRGRHVSRTHLERMIAFLGSARPGTRLELPGGLTLRCESSGFRLGPLGGPGAAGPAVPSGGTPPGSC